MGTYTTNKELFMPTIGEQGWGTLVNGNFETIDTFLKPITVSGNTYTFTGNQTGGSVSATSITNSGTLTNTGKITANGGIGTTSLTTSSTITSTGKITGNGGIGTKALTATTGTFSGAVTGSTINGATITSTKFNGATIDTSGNITGAKGTFSGTVSGTKFTRSTNYTVSGTAPANYSSKKIDYADLLCVLPVRDKPYNGNVVVKRSSASSGIVAFDVEYITSLGQAIYSTAPMPGTANGTCTITLSNATCLYINPTNFAFGNISVS